MEQKLATRMQAGTLRKLKHHSGLIDFCSNDYLGFARSAELKTKVEMELHRHSEAANGSTGSRLLAGNTIYAEALEQQLAKQFKSEAALLFNSGYDANIGLLSCVPQRGDTVLHDELIHASIIDGIRLSNATRYSFRHNDVEQLKEKLQRSNGRCFVVVESIYSMDGDSAPLQEIADLCTAFGANLIIDEAHATGLYNNGLVCQFRLQDKVFARIVTFGKALGCHGAVVLGNLLLIDYLINFSRSFIYTTAAPLHQLATIKIACELLSTAEEAQNNLKNNIAFFKKQLNTNMNNIELIESDSSIQCIILGSNEKAKSAAAKLNESGFDVRAIMAPTVPQGTERIRICLHSFNTTAEIAQLTSVIHTFLNE